MLIRYGLKQLSGTGSVRNCSLKENLPRKPFPSSVMLWKLMIEKAWLLSILKLCYLKIGKIWIYISAEISYPVVTLVMKHVLGLFAGTRCVTLKFGVSVLADHEKLSEKAIHMKSKQIGR